MTNHPDDTATARTWAVPDQPEGVTTVWEVATGLSWDFRDGLWFFEDDGDDAAGFPWLTLLAEWGPLTDRAPVTGAGDG